MMPFSNIFNKIVFVASKFIRQKLDILKVRFVRDVGILMSGTALAQVLFIISLPFITTLYNPEDFNTLAIYVSLLSVLSVAACLRLELAIPIPKDDVSAINLLVLSILFAGVSALIIGMLLLMWSYWIGEVVFPLYVLLLPFGVWFVGSYSAMQFWATRKKRFVIIARTRVMQAIIGISIQIGFGLLGLVPLGLLLGYMFLTGSGVFSFVISMLKNDKLLFSKVNVKSMIDVLKSYKNFPKYSVIDGIATNAAIQLPVLIIAIYAIGPEAGFLLIATKVVGTPIQMLGRAAAQVYLSRAPEHFLLGLAGEQLIVRRR